MTEPVRLAKRVVDLAGCSRREADMYVEGGWVSVDGVVQEEPGTRVTPEQVVALLPQATLVPAAPVTILLHKPAGMAYDALVAAPGSAIDPATHAVDDRSPLQFLKRHLNQLLVLTPLENQAAGLVVLSQDWQIRRKLVDDAARVEQEYIVEVGGALTPEALALLNHGLVWNGKPLPPIKVSMQNETRLRFALKTPDRGLIEDMCGKVGLTVVSSRRIRIGRLPMAHLPAGQWRYLLGYERF